jgi:hypothetical protein
VTVGKNIGFHANVIAHRALYGKPAAVYDWGNSFNDDAPASIFLSHCHGRTIFLCCGLDFKNSAPAFLLASHSLRG